MRIVIAGIVGGVGMFIWGAISHMALPIGEMGVAPLPDSVVPAMAQADMHERRMYLFPGMPNDASADAQKAWFDKYTAGPRGIVVFDNQPGVGAMSVSMLGMELLSNVLACLVLAFVLSRLECGAGDKIMIATLLGVFAWLSIEVSNWNWFRFPTAYTIGSLLDQGVGALVAGALITMALGRREPTVDEMVNRIRAERAGA